MIDFGRGVCGDLPTAESKEWLVTNGIGGFASGTIAGELTRRYHGLLIAALLPPVGRTLLVAKLDETITYDGQDYPLFTNRWQDETTEPGGHQHIERFHLEGTIPVWTFACADALIEKQVWMQHGANTTYVQYRMVRGQLPAAIRISALVNSRDFHGITRAGSLTMQVKRIDKGLRVEPQDGTPFTLQSTTAKAEPARAKEWVNGFALKIEQYRGFDGIEDHLHAGDFHAVLNPGESLCLVLSTEESPDLDGDAALEERRRYEQNILSLAPPVDDERIEWLMLAADQFIVRRAAPDGPDGSSVIAGYPWFADWGRDTMISLPGLTLATGRPEIAKSILRTFAHFVDQGLLPNRFPDAGETPEYNTVDATLWYFEAIRATVAATHDEGLLRDLYPVLREIIAWHEKGTRYQIHLDAADALISAGEPGVQLTWMDAKVEGWVVTPRIGKPVEINALWYNALRIMDGFTRQLGFTETRFAEMAERTREGFTRFWNPAAGYCYDVINGPDGKSDPALRPNQLFAVSLPHSPLNSDQQKAVVDACALHLLTSHGLRSLAPSDPQYIGHYGGTLRERDAAYHQGTVWGWLMGPFVSAHLRVYGNADQARGFLEPLLHHISDHGVGSISEIFDGDPPFTPRGCFAQAWSVAEVLRVWRQIERG